MAKLQKYFTSDLDFQKFYFHSTAGFYQAIGSSITGIYPALDSEKDAAEHSVKSLLKSGLLVRLSATVLVGNKKRNLSFLCNRAAIVSVLTAAIDKTFTYANGSTGQIKLINQKLNQISRG